MDLWKSPEKLGTARKIARDNYVDNCRQLCGENLGYPQVKIQADLIHNLSTNHPQKYPHPYAQTEFLLIYNDPVITIV